MFIFSLVWSLGASINSEFRKPFDIYLKKLINGDIELLHSEEKKKIKAVFPERGTLYDYKLTPKTVSHQNKSMLSYDWVLWVDTIDP